jgi:hypothetical protein
MLCSWEATTIQNSNSELGAWDPVRKKRPAAKENSASRVQEDRDVLLIPLHVWEKLQRHELKSGQEAGARDVWKRTEQQKINPTGKWTRKTDQSLMGKKLKPTDAAEIESWRPNCCGT